MTSGVPQGGKNQHSDNVNMASNDGKFQNLPRGGSKNQGGEHTNMPTNDGKMPTVVRGMPNNQYFSMVNVNPNDPAANMVWNGQRNQYMEPPNMNTNGGILHGPRIAQPHYAAVPVTSMTPTNPTIYSNGASLRQEGSNQFYLHMGLNAGAMATQTGFRYSANNCPISPYSDSAYYGQQPYNPYRAPAQQPYTPPMNVTTSEVPPSAPTAQLHHRERKPLLIVNPETRSIINVVPSKQLSTNTTPNTTVDADENEEVKNAFRKDFSAQVQNKIESDKKEKDGQEHVHPVAQSETKREAVLEESKKETDEIHESKETFSDEVGSVPEESKEKVTDAIPVTENNDAIDLSKANVEALPHLVKVCEHILANEIISENTPQPSKPDVEEINVQIDLVDKEISTSTSGEQASECEEMSAISPSPEEEEDKRIQEEEEEAERIRLREIELDNLLEELEKDDKECNEDLGFYGRKFLYCIRDIEKEFKRTEPPVPLEALKNTYAIDIQSMPKPTDKKRTDFNPSWLKNTTGQGPRKYPGRASHEHGRGPGGGGGGRNRPFTGRPSIDRAPKVQLQNKAEHAWKSDKDKKNEDAEGEGNKLKHLLKAVRSLLNKITPTTKDDLIKEFLALCVSGEPPNFNAPEGQLAQVIDIIFDKAVDEPKFCSLYSEICKRQVDAELKFGKNSAFRNALLNRSQNTFVNKTMEANKTAIDNETDEEKKKEMMLKYEEDYNKFRRRKFGNINFIGQLYYQSLLSTKIIQWCLYDLLRHCHPDSQGHIPEPPYDEESIHCATQLVEAVGKIFENSKDFEGAKIYLSQNIGHMLNIAPSCSPKIRFKIIGVKELWDNKWKQRKVVDQGPKKIAEIHKEIQAEQQQLIMERDAYDKKQVQGVRLGSNSLRRPSLPPPRNSLDSGANAHNRRAIAGTASHLVPTSAGIPRITSLSMSGGPPKKANWKTGSGGGGGSEAPGSRTIIQRNSGSHEANEKRKDLAVTKRDAALKAAREIGGNPANKSSSQISLTSQEDAGRSEEEKERQKKIERIANIVVNRLEELLNNELSEEELIEELFNWVNSEKHGKPELHNIFQQYSRAFIMIKPILRPSAAKILYKCLRKPKTKSSVIKGIENYCLWAIDVRAWEDNANLWELLADLLVRVLLRLPDKEVPDGSNSEEAKHIGLEDFSPVFLAAADDDTPGKTYSLLILTLKQMAEQLAKDSFDLTGIAIEFEALSCCKKLDQTRLDAALKRCNPDVPEFTNLYELLNN